MGNEESGGKFREFALAFLKEAKEDLETSKELLENQRYSRAVYFSQQCVEKSVKALLEMERVYVAEHDLSAFFVKFIYNNKDYDIFKKELEEMLNIIDFFEGEWSKTRYPKEEKGKILTPTEIYGYEDASESIDKSGKVLFAVTTILNKKFKIAVK